MFQCQGLVIQGKILQPNLTQEMTSGELKFALAVETVLNSIPQPEYRQLIVEALMVLTLIVEYKTITNLGGLITVEHLVHKANQIFLEDQVIMLIAHPIYCQSTRLIFARLRIVPKVLGSNP